jgi:hypothetical protein
MTHTEVYANEEFFSALRPQIVNSRRSCILTLCKFFMPTMFWLCMQSYPRNSPSWRALILLFKIQMTQFRSILLWSCGSSRRLSTNSVDWLHETVFLEKLRISQQVQKLLTFYRRPRFITVFTTPLHLVLSWIWSIQFTSPHLIFIRFILILSSKIYVVISSDLPNSDFPKKS